MKLIEYQEKAMGTCLPTCENIVYMLNGLSAEVGELNDKVAKWFRNRCGYNRDIGDSAGPC